jgi:DNA-binding CsgD family transcriptional regulator
MISERDFRTMRQIVAGADDADSGGMLPWSAMVGLRELIPCDDVTISLNDSNRRAFLQSQLCGDLDPIASDVWEGMRIAFWRHYWQSSCAYPDKSGDLTTITTLSDFESTRQLHSSPMYCEWMKPQGLEHEMMVCLPRQAGLNLRLFFWRGRGRDFADRDRDIAALLRPHLYRAYREQRRRHQQLPRLTDRQLQLLRLVADGYTNRQIGRRLSITEATVRKHLENIFDRIHVNSRTAAVARVFGDNAP